MFDFEPLERLLLSVDPETTKYEGNGKQNYTIWTPHGEIPQFGNGHRVNVAWRVQIDRFTKEDDDPIAAALYKALDEADFIAFEYLADFERDTEYIHHIYDCEVY